MDPRQENAAPGDYAALYRLQRLWEQRTSYCSAARARRAVIEVTRRCEQAMGRTASTCPGRSERGMYARRTCGTQDRVFLAAFGSKLMPMRRPLLNALFSLALLTGPAVLLIQHPINLQAQQRTMRLILKDGSFQSVSQYEIQGDRVHYLSAERYEWEDIPSSLIDWEATKKYEADLSSGKMAKRIAETPEEKEEREKEEANSPEISPGMRLPGSGGVFLLEQFDGKPELAEILQHLSLIHISEPT